MSLHLVKQPQQYLSRHLPNACPYVPISARSLSPYPTSNMHTGLVWFQCRTGSYFDPTIRFFSEHWKIQFEACFGEWSKLTRVCIIYLLWGRRFAPEPNGCCADASGLVLKLQRNVSAHVTLTAGEKLRPSGAAEKFNYSIDESGVDITNSDSLFFCPPLPSSFSITLSITGNNVNLFVFVRKLDFTCHSWGLCTFF